MTGVSCSVTGHRYASVPVAVCCWPQADSSRTPQCAPPTVCPDAPADTMGAPGNTGSAHEAAIRIGAATDLMDQAWWSPGLTHPDGRSTFSLGITGGILVDSAGRRFVNESAPPTTGRAGSSSTGCAMGQ